MKKNIKEENKTNSLILYYISPSDDPYYNLSLEDWALREFDTQSEELIIFYINKPSVVIGRNQNIFEEIDFLYCEQNNISIARRISGGGTVFHDFGNLNWCIVSKYEPQKVNNYKWASKYILEYIEANGINANLNNRNAIEIVGEKVSGQAQFTNRKNILSHGTLLINSNLVFLQKAITPNLSINIKSKATQSVRSTVANLNQFLSKEISANKCIKDLVKLFNFKETNLPKPIYINRFMSDEWIYNRSPKFEATLKTQKEIFKVRVEKGVVVKTTPSKPEKYHNLVGKYFKNILDI